MRLREQILQPLWGALVVRPGHVTISRQACLARCLLENLKACASASPASLTADKPAYCRPLSSSSGNRSGLSGPGPTCLFFLASEVPAVCMAWAEQESVLGPTLGVPQPSSCGPGMYGALTLQ